MLDQKKEKRKRVIEVDFGNFKVRREYHGEKKSLIVTGKDGSKIKNPIEFLKSIEKQGGGK